MSKNGRFAVIQRLTGVSTTDVTGKLLNLIEKVQNEAQGSPHKSQASTEESE
jgi:hypothetical protein